MIYESECKTTKRKLNVLHHSHGVFESALVLSGLGHTHRGFQQDFHGRLGHVVVTVEFLANFFAHLVNHSARVCVEQINETLQHVQMESRGNQFAMSSPFLS